MSKPSKPKKSRYPYVRQHGTGFRAEVRIDGKLWRGQTRSTDKQAHDDALTAKRRQDLPAGTRLMTLAQGMIAQFVG